MPVPEDEPDLVVMLSVEKLLDQWPNLSPFDQDPWELPEPITRDEVQRAIDDGSHAQATEPWTDIYDREYHVRRVAHFVVEGWEDPLDMDLGVPVLGFVPEHPLHDGNHRFAAAIFRGQASVGASVSGQIQGWIDHFQAA